MWYGSELLSWLQPIAALQLQLQWSVYSMNAMYTVPRWLDGNVGWINQAVVAIQWLSKPGLSG